MFNGGNILRKMNTISNEYKKLLTEHHEEKETWGTSGVLHLKKVLDLIHSTGSKSVLDYGCGKGTLGEKVKDSIEIDWTDYDPAIRGKRVKKKCDLVVCTDVMEHVEEEFVDAVLSDISELSNVAYVHIACGAAGEILADGRNAHITQRSIEWWQDMVEKNMDGTKEYFPERHRPRGGMNGRRSGEDIALTVIVTK